MADRQKLALGRYGFQILPIQVIYIYKTLGSCTYKC